MKKLLLILILSFATPCFGQEQFPPQPYFFSETSKTLFDGYKTTYKDYKNSIDFDRFIIVWEYAKLKGVDISEIKVSDIEEYFASRGKDNTLMTELLDEFFKTLKEK